MPGFFDTQVARFYRIYSNGDVLSTYILTYKLFYIVFSQYIKLHLQNTIINRMTHAKDGFIPL